MEKVSIHKKAMAIAFGISMLTACTSINPHTGKAETDTLKTTGVGAGVGAVFGALVGGKQGALIGAAVGGGVGYLAALEARKQELAEAVAAADEFKAETGIAQEIKKATYQAQSGDKTEGLKSVDVKIPAAAISPRGDGLTEKGKQTFAKLNAMAAKTGTLLVVAVPRSIKQGVVADISAAAPSARIAADDGKGVLATLKAKPVEAGGLMMV